MTPEPDIENLAVTWKSVAMAGAAVTLVASLVFWAATVAGRVTEQEKVLAEHQAAIKQLQEDQKSLLEKMNASLSVIATDQAVTKEKLSTVSETLARLDGRLTPSVLPTQSVAAVPQRSRR